MRLRVVTDIQGADVLKLTPADWMVLQPLKIDSREGCVGDLASALLLLPAESTLPQRELARLQQAS